MYPDEPICTIYSCCGSHLYLCASTIGLFCRLCGGSICLNSVLTEVCVNSVLTSAVSWGMVVGLQLDELLCLAPERLQLPKLLLIDIAIIQTYSLLFLGRL